MKILLLLLLLISSVAHADVCDRVFFSAISYHLNRDENFNEVNPGIGCVRELTDDWRATVGTYKNSFSRQTMFVSTSYKAWDITYNLHVVGTVGLATGYSAAIMPIAYPELRLDLTKKFDVSFAAIPPVGGASGVAALYGTFAW